MNYVEVCVPFHSIVKNILIFPPDENKQQEPLIQRDGNFHFYPYELSVYCYYYQHNTYYLHF